MNAATLATALGGRKAGAGWTAPCPVHEDRTPSLAIRDAKGKVLVRCHAGCSQRDVIAALKKRGLWAESALPLSSRGRSPERIDRRPDQDEARRSAAALAIWQLAIPGSGTIVETPSGCLGLEDSALHGDALLVFPEGTELLDDGSIRYRGHTMRVDDRVELTFGGAVEGSALREICAGHDGVVIATSIESR